MDKETMFPSPVGELYFSMIEYLTKDKDGCGFRPLSGTYISQYYYVLDTMTYKVSVPCRGLIFLNGKLRGMMQRVGFPSPVGDLYFSIRSSSD